MTTLVNAIFSRNTVIAFVFCVFFAVASIGRASDESSALSLSFGVVPQQSAQKLASVWQPLLALLSAETGYALKFKTAPTIPEFEKRLAASEYEVAYMNPYHFTVFNVSPGYHAIAHAKDKRIKGIIVVRKDSEIQSLEALSGAIIAFPAPAAFAASVLPRANLAAKNIRVEPKYVQTHDSVYLTVAKGIYPAGGGILRTFNGMPEDVKTQLRVLWTTPGYTPHAIATAPELPEGVKQKLQTALLKLDLSSPGQIALNNLGIDGFQAAADADWDDVRALGIELLKNLQQDSAP